MKTATLLFPHQLFINHPALEKDRPVYMLEHPMFFGTDTQYPFRMHMQKLVLHRASMMHYADALNQRGYQVQYVKHQESELESVFQNLVKEGIASVHVVDPVDDVLSKRLNSSAKKNGITIHWQDSPNFFNTSEQNTAFFAERKRYFMKDFYQHQRKHWQVLMTKSGKPQGGQWSFDADNRKKIPSELLEKLPQFPSQNRSHFVEDAQQSLGKEFPNALGSSENFFYPINREQAKRWLDEFLEKRFEQFGPYEDAIVQGESMLFHSLLTPALNIGLLSPQEVVKAALQKAEKDSLPIASVEGFVRQIIGWREFMRSAYEDMGVQMRNGNNWKHKRKMPKSCYDGSTGIQPVDDVIQRVLQTGYCHHIERLMVLGGFFFLCEIHPREIYTWFMELFVDSYDWVMVPNVYAMSQNSCGGLITTKPYFSGSNYIRKMSHYKTGEWADIWDGLYWRFIDKHQDRLKNNPRWSMMIRQLQKKDPEQMQEHKRVANAFLKTLS